MNIIKTLAVTAVALSLSGVPAAAGNTSMSASDGTKLKIKCTGGGCVVRQKKPGAKWGIVEKTAGGTKNFKKLVTKYEGAGYSN